MKTAAHPDDAVASDQWAACRNGKGHDLLLHNFTALSPRLVLTGESAGAIVGVQGPHRCPASWPHPAGPGTMPG